MVLLNKVPLRQIRVERHVELLPERGRACKPRNTPRKAAFWPADSATCEEYGQTGKRNGYHHGKIEANNGGWNLNSRRRNNAGNTHQVKNIATDNIADGDIPKPSAKRDAPLTKASAPTIKKTNPALKKTKAIRFSQVCLMTAQSALSWHEYTLGRPENCTDLFFL